MRAIVWSFVAVWAVFALADQMALAAPLANVLSPGFGLLAVVAGGAVALTSSLDRAVRLAWAAMAAGFACVLAGDLLWVWMARQGEVPFPSIANPLYLAIYPLLLLGLLCFPSRAGPGLAGVSMGLDLALVFTASTVAIWDAILRPVTAEYADDGWALLFAAGPPVGDLVVAAGLVVALRRRPDAATGEALVRVTAGMLAYVVSDLLYAWASLHDAYVEGGIIEAGWMCGTLLFVHGAVRQVRGGGSATTLDRADRALERGAILLPVGAIGLGFVLILRVFSAQTLDQGHLGTALGAALLCAIVLVRETVSAVQQSAMSRELATKNALLAWESERSERLLRNVLPDAIADRLKDSERDRPLAESVPSATVLFADLVGFTTLSARIAPERLLEMLDRVFSQYDALAGRHGLEKIKTIGDAYMAAAGVPLPHPDPVAATVRMALEMQAVVAGVSADLQATGDLVTPLQVRVGVHTGPLVAGVIGRKKFSYDLWGDTVNTASRMESHGVAGRVQVTDAVRQALGERFRFEDRGEIDVKGRGVMRCWLVVDEQ